MGFCINCSYFRPLPDSDSGLCGAQNDLGDVAISEATLHYKGRPRLRVTEDHTCRMWIQSAQSGSTPPASVEVAETPEPEAAEPPAAVEEEVVEDQGEPVVKSSKRKKASK